MKIKGVIFDADGTLLDSMKFCDESVLRLIRSMGIAPDDRLTEILTPMSMEEGAKFLKKEYDLPVSENEIIDRENKFIEKFYSREVTLRSGAVEFLNCLKEKNIPMTVASATDRYLIEMALKRLEIFDYFRAVISCTDIGEGKTSPEIFYSACEIMDTLPGETLVAEDSLIAIKTAKKAGFITMGVYDESQKRNREDIVKISDLFVEKGFDINILLTSC